MIFVLPDGFINVQNIKGDSYYGEGPKYYKYIFIKQNNR